MPRIRCSTSSKSNVESTACPASYRTAILFMVPSYRSVAGDVGYVPKVTTNGPNSSSAAQGRKSAAHGVSRGATGKRDQPQRGEREAVTQPAKATTQLLALHLSSSYKRIAPLLPSSRRTN